jgi:hypothetical protein
MRRGTSIMKVITAIVSNLVLVALLFASQPSSAEEPFTAKEAYKTMLALEGSWIGESLVVPVGKSKDEGTKSESSITYRVIANGSSLIGTYLEGSPMEMVSVYHQDGPDKLIHTHYCAVGNQPTMAFKPSMESGVIDFKFLKGSNMDVKKDGHVHNGYIKIIDKDTFETKTELWNEGKVSSIRYSRMTRKKN